MAVERLRCDADSLEVFHIIDNIIWGQGNTALLHCTANQADTGHKLHFQPRNPARAKFTAINNKNGCGTVEVRFSQLGRVSYHWYYHIRPVKRQLCSAVTPPSRNRQKTPFLAQKSSLGQIGSNQQKKWMWHGWGVMQTVQRFFISFILSDKVR